MKTLYTLILQDKTATLIAPDHSRRCLESPHDLLGILPTSLHLVLNHSELDISPLTLPRLSFFDRQKFLRTRKKYKRGSLFYGLTLHKNNLIEFSCPHHDALLEWIQELLHH